MKPVKQTLKHDPDNGVYGDCVRAAIASILELSIVDVPHFFGNGETGEEGYRAINEFLEAFDLSEVSIPFEAEKSDLSLEQILRCGASYCGKSHYMLCGKSRTGINHVVVCYGNQIVHDPSLTDSGIIGPCSDGHYWISVLARR